MGRIDDTIHALAVERLIDAREVPVKCGIRTNRSLDALPRVASQ